MNKILRILGFCAAAFPLAVAANPPDNVKSDALKNAVILVIRHGEKTAKGKNLSPAGKARANAYADYFKNYKVDDQPFKLNALFAAADSKESHRPRETIEPTAKALGLKINSSFEDMHYQKLADELRHKPHGNGILICWHHGEIPKLLEALGADTRQVIPKSGWPDDVFNWVIQLQYDSDGRLARIQQIVEPF